jgi:hypothetical protein
MITSLTKYNNSIQATSCQQFKNLFTFLYLLKNNLLEKKFLTIIFT